MRRWILPLILLAIAGFGAWQAVLTDEAIAAETSQAAGPAGPELTTPLLSVRRTPEYLREPIILENLSEDLRALTRTFPTQSCLVVTQNGLPVFEHNPTLPLVPASAQKIVTAYGVYELLGSDHTYETRLVSNVPIVEGVIDGDIWLIGGGDPLVATADYIGRYEEQPHQVTSLSALADAVARAGVTEITGSVIGDETRFDSERYVPEWPERFTNAQQNQTGPLSALTVNDGFTRYDSVNPANSLSSASTDPAGFAADFFDDLLEARDIIIRGASGSGVAPLGVNDLVPPLVSDPITAVTNQMVSISDNMAAEMLLKEVGVEIENEGSTLAGGQAIESMLAEQGFSVAETDVVDGSGLASENRLTCRLLTEVLDRSQTTTPLRDGLAIAGQTGTLRERMEGTPAVGRILAKTGRLNEVGALAGIAIANDDSELTFAWIANTTDVYPVDDMIAAQDNVSLELIEYPEGPSADALSPTP